MACIQKKEVDNKYNCPILKVYDELWDEIITVLPEEKPSKTVGRPIAPFKKALDGIMYILQDRMPVEVATKRTWLWFHMPQTVSGVGSVRYIQKTMD